MTKVNPFRQGSILILAIAGLLSQSIAQSRCSGPSTSPSTGCTGFKTFTQGGWGGPSNGGPGRVLNAGFATAFPLGLQIGCTNTLKLTSASAVRDFLPSGGTPAKLPNGNLVNPTRYGNTLAGQLVAVTLAVGFDDAIESFSPSALKLRNLIIASGPFAGWKVETLLAEANKKVGNCSASPFSYSQFNDALTRINENYDNGTSNKGFLNCPPLCENVTTGGTIAANEGNCGSFDPAEITSTAPAAGGSGALAYAWYSSPNGSDWTLIDGATSASYDPGNIFSTTHYKRVATRANCTVGVSSNVVVKSVFSAPSASAEGGIQHVLCKGGSTGSVTLSVNGGSPDYSFAWSNGATTQNLSGVAAGNYSVEVTDANGCKANASATVTEPDSLVVTGALTNASACFCSGTAILEVSGGTPEYSYNWSTGATSASLTGLCLGQSISVTVTDANGCQVSEYILGTVDMVRGCVAAEVVENHQGLRNNGTPVDADRSNPNAMLGTPDASNAVGGFFALGFGGWVVLKLDGAITDRPGNDLKVFETTYNNQVCNQYPEYVQVSVSPDNVTWTDLGVVCMDGELDIAPAGNCILYVKLTDATNPNATQFRGQIVDGYDVDGVKCLAPATNARAAVQSESSAEEGNARWVSPTVNLFPNPADSRITLELSGVKEGQEVKVTLVNHVGQVVRAQKIRTGAGVSSLEIPMEGLSRGIYSVNLNGGDVRYSKKITKK